MWPITRPSELAAAISLATFGAVDLVLLLAEPALGVALLVLAVGLAAYLLGVWSLREPMGLNAFRSALRRRALSGTPGAGVASSPRACGPGALPPIQR
jgi:hypothetical protein